MKKAVVCISDVHLGSGNSQDSFTDNGAGVTQFAAGLEQGAKAGVDLTLALNGDIFDLWEIVSDAELQDGPAGDAAIETGLLVPTRNATQMRALETGLADRLSRALTCHRSADFCGMLRRLERAGVKLHFNVGNHDHQLHTPNGKAILDAALKSAGVWSSPFSTGRYLLDHDLGFYAEHGDQFADGDSMSPLEQCHGDRFDEANGIYFLRYVWNRLEASGYGYVQHANLDAIYKVLRTLFSGGGPFPRFLDYLGSYFSAVKTDRVPLVHNPLIRSAYYPWLAGSVLKDILSDPAAEWNRPVPFAMSRFEGEVLDAAPFAATVPDWLPGGPVAPRKFKLDNYAKGMRSRFTSRSPFFPELDQRVLAVCAGHTHEERSQRLMGGVSYHNCGSWTKGHALTYVWAYGEDGKGISSGLHVV